jgi:hypothetical protein
MPDRALPVGSCTPLPCTMAQLPCVQIDVMRRGVPPAHARQLSTLSHLRSLSIGKAGSPSQALATMPDLPQLTRLHLDWVAGPQPHHIAALQALRRLAALELTASGMSVASMTAIARLPALEHLALAPDTTSRSSAYLSSAMVAALAPLTRLAVLELRHQRELEADTVGMRELGVDLPTWGINQGERLRRGVRDGVDKLAQAQRDELIDKLGALRPLVAMRRLRRLDVSFCTRITPLSLLVLEHLAGWHECVVLQAIEVVYED